MVHTGTSFDPVSERATERGLTFAAWSDEFPLDHDPVVIVHSLRGHAQALSDSYRGHEYWSDPLVRRQVLRSAAEVVDDLGRLASRLTDDDPAVAAAADHLAGLLTGYGRGDVGDPDRPPKPFPPPPQR